ncbi:glycosyltransferase family 4 protein [Methylovulum psychrotolerans]|uniref:Colanic acid biosynthesis glycosyltransferase WcaL n=1 Tax=Methylovulum psychrotolerans TaxID=1704499 RepID=A0A2S5CMY7_9GAMM|nr:glycosyltransferase family 4 protein [Methylovulum psychrotolerans]POZ52102.1 colanic acid biosynthesis glycosyltransferase WcaL [Methylovulum psychrotolerans]
MKSFAPYHRMKTLFVVPTGQAFGSEKSLLGLLSAARQIIPHVICAPIGPLNTTLQTMGINTYTIEFGKYAFKKQPLWHLMFLIKIIIIIKKVNPDVLVINLEGNTPLIVFAAFLMRVPVIRFSRFEFTPPKRWIDKLSWLKCAAVICPSDYVCQQVLSWVPSHHSLIVQRLYNPQAIDSSVQCLEDDTGSKGSSKIIVFLGRIHPGKRVDTVIRALQRLKLADFTIRLLIVGSPEKSVEGEAYFQSMVSLVNHLGLEDSVDFLGYRNDIPAIMSVCDACVLPSESESFGRVLVEAWACEVPTVASNVSGCREITLASKGGFLAEVGDDEEFAGCILQLLENPLLSKEMGRLGKKWVTENCNPQIYAEAFENIIYRSLNANKG